jgi:hypothetical protein
MDVRQLGGIAVVVVAGVVAAALVMGPEPVVLEPVPAPVDAGTGVASAAPAVDVPAGVEAPADTDAAPSGMPYGVPDAAAQKRLEEAAGRPLSVAELMAGNVPATRTSEVWHPPVQAADSRVYRTAPGQVVAGDATWPPDVRGIERMLLARSADVDTCMKWNAPPRQGAEENVVASFTLVPDGADKGKIGTITILADETGRYASFSRCLSDVLASASFTALRNPQEVVQWALHR